MTEQRKEPLPFDWNRWLRAQIALAKTRGFLSLGRLAIDGQIAEQYNRLLSDVRMLATGSDVLVEAIYHLRPIVFDTSAGASGSQSRSHNELADGARTMLVELQAVLEVLLAGMQVEPEKEPFGFGRLFDRRTE